MKTIFTLFAFCFVATAVYANGIGIVDGNEGQYLKVKETHTSVLVKDQIAITVITQVLENDTGIPAVFKYGLPINENANPTSLRWNYAGVWTQAAVNSDAQDNSIPGGGNVGGGGPSSDLTSYLTSNVLFFSPKDTIAVGATVTMEVTYVELLPYFNGKVSYFQKSDISALQSSEIELQSFTFRLESEKEVLDIELAGLEFDLVEEGDVTTLIFSIQESFGDFDYNIGYELSSTALGINSISTYVSDSSYTCDENGRGYFAFIVEPESNVDTEVIEKNFSLIIDRSGSMSGDKIEQAKDAATFIVQNLNVGDYFNIIDFSLGVTSFSESLVEYNVDNEAAALEYIDQISAGGSTNISGSLVESISQFPVIAQDKANIIIFCTDGNATSGITDTPGILELVQEEANSEEKSGFLFTIGIGENLDQALLTLLAKENNGLVQFIDPVSLEEDLVKFFLSVNNPVLLNTSILITPDIIKEIYPYPYPNLYKGQQLVLTGRYEEAADIEITLEGTAFNVPVTYDFQVSLSDTANTTLSFIPKVWAKQKLDALAIEFYLGADQEARDSITTLIDSLSKCYGVIDVEFSSFEDDTTVETDDVLTSDEDDKIWAYPSPFESTVTLHVESVESISKKINVAILDVNARTIMTQEVYMKDGSILLNNLDHLSGGVYFAVFEIGTIRYVVKIVKCEY